MFHVSGFIAAHFRDTQLSGFQEHAYRGYLSEQHGRPDHATAACGRKVPVHVVIPTASLTS